MTPKPLRQALATVAGLSLAACGVTGDVKDDKPQPPQLEIARSPLARATNPAPADDVAELVAGVNGFGTELLGRLRKPGEDLLVSPVSIEVALGMTWAGARGQTESQMAQALRFTLPQDRLHPAMGTLDLALSSRGQGAQGADGEPFRLRISNAAWAQRDFSFEPAYLDTLATGYGAGVNLLDFAGAPEPSRQTINAWVSWETEEKIPELLAEGSIRHDTRLVLTNAVYFNAAWEKQFTKEATHQATFILADGTQVEVPTMSQIEGFRFADEADYQAVELPYDGGEISMVVIVPKAGALTAFEATFDAARFAAIVAGLSPAEVDLRLPKFTFEWKSSLKETLEAMGMPDAFSSAADFSGMSSAASLVITDVVHQTFVAVDEKGTEAAAATAVVVGETSIPMATTMKVDRPFLFAIRDVATGAVLFLGEVYDPR